MPIFKKKAEPKKKEEAKEKKAAAPAKKAAAKPATKPAVNHKKETKEVKAEAPVRATGNAWRILVRPLITERYSGQGRDYAFEVNPKANKLEIRQAIKDVFGVTAASVRVMNMLGKAVRTNAGYSQRSNWRKAIVSLKKGESIDLFAKNA